MLQSLFTWIFYLFRDYMLVGKIGGIASILIHLDFLSILSTPTIIARRIICFNPYSPGFSIYLLDKTSKIKSIKGFNPYSPGFSIYFSN